MRRPPGAYFMPVYPQPSWWHKTGQHISEVSQCNVISIEHFSLDDFEENVKMGQLVAVGQYYKYDAKDSKFDKYLAVTTTIFVWF